MMCVVLVQDLKQVVARVTNIVRTYIFHYYSLSYLLHWEILPLSTSADATTETIEETETIPAKDPAFARSGQE
jgi:hypothetical protein